MNMSNISQYLKTAFEYKNSGNYKEAIDYFYKALALDNDSLEIICELAFLYGKLCQYDRAVSLYEQFLQKNPDDNSVKYNYAMLCKQIKNYVKAEKILIELFEKGYDINRVAGELFEIFLKNKEYEKIISYYIRKTNVLNTSLNLYYIGLAYLKTEKRNIAEELFKKSFELDKNNIESGIIIVEMLFEQELYSEAEELILQLLKLSENDRLFYILAEIYYLRNEIDNAIKYYSYAIKINDKNPVYFFKIGVAFSLKGFFNEAEESFCRAIILEPENLTYNYALAYLYYMNKKYVLSEKITDNLLLINREYIQALALKLILLTAKNEAVQASKILEKIIHKDEKDDFVYYAIAGYYEKLSIWDKAINAVKEAVRLNGNSVEYLYKLAKYYYNLGQFEKSIDICDEIIVKNPKYIDTYILLANIFLTKKDYKKVLDYAKQILNLDINCFDAYFLIGIVDYEHKQYESAINNFKTAVSIRPDNEKCYKKIALCYFILEKYENAYFYFKEAAEIDITNPEYRFYMAKCCIKTDDRENAISNFSIMKRLAPSNLEYIKEYADYMKSIGNERKALSILKSTAKSVSSKEEKEKIKEIMTQIKK